MNHLVKSGCRVHACWAHSTPVRMQESLVAMNLIGLDDGDCRFGDLPDGGFLSDLLSMDSWVHDVLEDTMADRYVTPAFEQGHLDHDALHYAVHRWTGHRHWEFPMYWHYARVWQRIGEFADPTGEEVWPLDDETMDLKREMIQVFESQTVARNLVGYEILERLKGARLGQMERMRHVVKPNYSEPVHPEPARTKIIRSQRWKQWDSGIRQWVESAGDPNWT